MGNHRQALLIACLANASFDVCQVLATGKLDGEDSLLLEQEQNQLNPCKEDETIQKHQYYNFYFNMHCLTTCQGHLFVAARLKKNGPTAQEVEGGGANYSFFRRF